MRIIGFSQAGNASAKTLPVLQDGPDARLQIAQDSVALPRFRARLPGGFAASALPLLAGAAGLSRWLVALRAMAMRQE